MRFRAGRRQGGGRFVQAATGGHGRRVWTWVAAGTAGALLVGGVIFGVKASSDYDEIKTTRDPRRYLDQLRNYGAEKFTANLVGSGPTQDKWLFNPDSTQVLTPDSGTFAPGSDMSISGFLLARNNGGHRVECSSCHDVHNQEGTPFDITTNPKLVRIVGTQGGKGSLLCRSCHNK